MKNRLLLLGAAAAIGCGTGSPSAPSAPTDDAGTPATIGPTFHKDVQAILQKACQGCHVEGGIAPFALLTYSDAKAYADDIVTQTSARKMPPWGAAETAECTPRFKFKDDVRLPDADLATLKAWVAAGKLEGDPKDAPPAPPARVTGLPGVQLELKPQTPYTLAAQTDQFRCFVLDPKLTQTTYVNGTFVIPGNPQIVHHALVFADPSGASKQKADPVTGQYDCFGGAGISGATLLSAWAPGGIPNEYPSNASAPLAAGTLLVMQVHYHPHLPTAFATDQTTFQMRFSPTPPEYIVRTLLLGNFTKAVANGIGLLPGPDDPDPNTVQFLIPANKSGHVETMHFTLPATISGVPTPTGFLYGVGAHMHLVGVDEKVTLHRAAPTATAPADECLLHEPRWDFNWQRGYAYDTPITSLPTVGPGDSVDVRCTYDNTMANPKLADALAQQSLTAPRDVKLGETTLDEMCLTAVQVLYKAP